MREIEERVLGNLGLKGFEALHRYQRFLLSNQFIQIMIFPWYIYGIFQFYTYDIFHGYISSVS